MASDKSLWPNQQPPNITAEDRQLLMKLQLASNSTDKDTANNANSNLNKIVFDFPKMSEEQKNQVRQAAGYVVTKFRNSLPDRTPS
jgi:hypothetical protein